MRPLPSITIPDDAWSDASGDHPAGTRLLTGVVINGVPHHFEAREVTGDDQNFRAWPEDAGLLAAVTGAEGRWQTVAIGGRDYVLFASPYC